VFDTDNEREASIEDPKFHYHPLTRFMHVGFVAVCLYIVVMLVVLVGFEFWKWRQPPPRADLDAEDMQELTQFEH
jgi:hypothetical protein